MVRKSLGMRCYLRFKATLLMIGFMKGINVSIIIDFKNKFRKTDTIHLTNLVE